MFAHEIAELNALRFPQRVALGFEDGTAWTWGELWEAAQRSASGLRALGVQPGERVAALSRNRLELYALWLGTNLVGAVYAPVNYRFVAREVHEMLADCQPAVVISEPALAEVATGAAGLGGLAVRSWLTLDEFDDLARATTGSAPAPAHRAGRDEVAFICYTGGTTGRAKGVMITHGNIESCVVNFALCNQVREDDVYLLAGAMFYIAIAVPVAFWAAGARTVVVNFDAAGTLDVMAREGVTRLIGTGTIFKMLVDEQESRPRALPAMRNIDFGGAPMSARLARRARDAFGCTVAQIYGQSETTLLATYLYPDEYEDIFAAMDRGENPARAASVGRAGPTLAIAVLDEDDRPLPPGEVGEVCLRGGAVMAGYWGQAELSAETMRNGWHHSGDLGHLDADGYVYLVDRAKDLIITGGENVYSAEVELILADHPAVSEALVIGLPDDQWGERVHAVVVARDADDPPSGDALIEWCREHLARFKAPRSIEFRAEIPRLATGKVAKGQVRAELTAGRRGVIGDD